MIKICQGDAAGLQSDFMTKNGAHNFDSKKETGPRRVLLVLGILWPSGQYWWLVHLKGGVADFEEAKLRTTLIPKFQTSSF